MYKATLNKIVFIMIILLHTKVYALDPVANAWYAGIFLGPSATAASNFDFGSTVTFQNTNGYISASSGTIKEGVLGGIGGQVGYRFCLKHRIEAEWYYNNNHIKSLQLSNYSIYLADYPSLNVTNVNKVFQSNTNTSYAYVQGDTNTGALMMNFIYDFFAASKDGYSKVVPFVGVGLGYAYVQNALQLYRPTTIDPDNDPISNREVLEVLQTRWIYAAQIMAGVNYFMDDFTWFGIDARFFRTGSSTAPSRYTAILLTETETVTSNSSLFNKNTQIISINLSFNGVFNFG